MDPLINTLRERRGLEPDDASQDDEINALSPMEKFREQVTWEFGDPSWADTLIAAMEECGFVVVPTGASDEQEP